MLLPLYIGYSKQNNHHQSSIIFIYNLNCAMVKLLELEPSPWAGGGKPNRFPTGHRTNFGRLETVSCVSKSYRALFATSNIVAMIGMIGIKYFFIVDIL